MLLPPDGLKCLDQLSDPQAQEPSQLTLVTISFGVALAVLRDRRWRIEAYNPEKRSEHEGRVYSPGSRLLRLPPDALFVRQRTRSTMDGRLRVLERGSAVQSMLAH